MFAMTATVCEGWGTDATVKLRLSTKGGDGCFTNDLDDRWNNWKAGSTRTWLRNDGILGNYLGNYLGNCKSFRPTERLQAKFVLRERWGQELDAPDLMKICKLTVSFGKGSSKKEGREQWEWSGEKIVSSRDEESENWLKLVQVPYSPHPLSLENQIWPICPLDFC